MRRRGSVLQKRAQLEVLQQARHGVLLLFPRDGICRWSQSRDLPLRSGVANSLLLTLWRDYKQRKSRSAGQEGSAAMTISRSGYRGAHSSMRRCIYVAITMAGRPRSVRLDSSVRTAFKFLQLP